MLLNIQMEYEDQLANLVKVTKVINKIWIQQLKWQWRLQKN